MLVALALYCIAALALYVGGSLGARPVIDDAWGILRRADEGPWLTVWHALTEPAYAQEALPGVLNGAPGSAGYAWGPFATLLQAAVAAVFGRDSLTPFRIVNVAAQVCGALGVAGALKATGASLRCAAAAAAFFLAHPVAAESVPWASDLFDVLGAAALTCGLWAAARTTTPAGYAGVSAAGVLGACLCKPTAAPLCLVYPLLAAVSGRGRATILASAAASLCAGVLFLLWYREVSHSEMAGQAVSALVGSSEARTTFAVSYGLSLLDAVRPLEPPAVMRYLVPAVDGPRAVAGAMALLLAVGLLAIGVRRRLPAAEWASAAIVIWAIGLVPGSLIAVVLGTHGARYSLLPLAASLPFAARALTLALEGAALGTDGHEEHGPAGASPGAGQTLPPYLSEIAGIPKRTGPRPAVPRANRDGRRLRRLARFAALEWRKMTADPGARFAERRDRRPAPARWAPIVVGAALGLMLVANLRWLAIRVPAYAGDVAFFAAEAANPEFAAAPTGPRLAVFAAQAAFFASVDPAGAPPTNPCVTGLAYVEAVDRLGPEFAAAQTGRYQRAAALLAAAGDRASRTGCGPEAHDALFRSLAARLAPERARGP